LAGTNTILHHKVYAHSPEADWVVFIHGAGGSSSIWFKQIKAYKKHFNLLLIDMRGHGKSQDLFQKYTKYTFKELSLEIVEVMDHLKIPAAHFVGISLGTILIRTLGETHPECIKSMVMGGAVTRLNTRSQLLAWSGNMVKRFVPFMWLYSLFAWIIMPKKRHEASRSFFINEAKKLCHKEFLRWYKLLYEVNPLLRYFTEKEISVPTLYVMGDEDYMFLPPVRLIVQKHKFASLEVVADSGHVCNIDQPERFNEVSISFIKRHVGLAITA
jgi:pimeloyl-ACP methyl ester carboxylesterase